MQSFLCEPFARNNNIFSLRFPYLAKARALASAIWAPQVQFLLLCRGKAKFPAFLGHKILNSLVYAQVMLKLRFHRYISLDEWGHLNMQFVQTPTRPTFAMPSQHNGVSRWEKRSGIFSYLTHHSRFRLHVYFQRQHHFQIQT